MNPDHINHDWHLDLPHSFGGKYRSYDYYNELTKHQVDEELKKNDIYTKFLQYKRAKHHNPVYVYGKREQFQADTVKFPDPLMKKASRGNTNLLVIIDVFTKYVWLYPLPNIKGSNIAKCLREVFSINRPQKFTTDAGTEFLNRDVTRVLNDFNIKHYVAKGRTKASVAERFNLTIQRLIYQLCRHHNTNDWTSDIVLGKATKIYLNRKHRTIKMSPAEAELPKSQKKLSRIYHEKYRKATLTRKKKLKFKVGDTVRISILRTPFKRGYHQYFTTEVWTVSRVLNNLPLPRYIVKDAQNNELDNVLNENELVAYIPKNEYKIEKILKRRTRKGKKEVLVSWLGYDARFNSWVKVDDLVPI